MIDTSSKIPPSAKKVFAGVLFDVYQWQQELYDGSTGTFEMVKRIDASIVVAITPDLKVLLIDDRQPNRETRLTFPGGHLEKGEDSLAAAKRELLEETGYTGDSWELWQVFHPSSKIDCNFHYYLARGVKKVSQPIEQKGEIITLKLVSIDEFLEGIVSGKQQAYDLGANLLRQIAQGKRHEITNLLAGSHK